MKTITISLWGTLMTAVSLVFAAHTAEAGNALSVQPVIFEGYNTVNVPVVLDNTNTLTQVQFDIELPSYLEITGQPAKAGERIAPSMLNYNPDNGRFTVMNFGWPTPEIVPGDDAIFTIPMKVRDGMLDPLKEVEETSFTLSGIVLVGYPENENEPVQYPQSDLEVPATLFNGNAPVGHLYTEQTAIDINPGQTVGFSVALSSNFAAYGAQFDMTVPEGFTISTTEYVVTDRVDNNAGQQLTVTKDGVYRFLIFGLTLNPLVSEGDGNVVTFYLTAPADFTEESATVEVDGVLSYVTTTGSTIGVPAGGYSFELLNGYPSLVKANDEIAALEDALASALATIDEECPAVKEQFDGNEIEARVEDLKAAVAAANEANTLRADYTEVMAPAAGIATDIVNLVAEAKAAQAAADEEARVAANEAAYAAVLEQLDALQSAIDEAKAAIAGQYPDVDVTEETEAAQAALDAQKEAAAAAYEAVAEEGVYEFEVDGTEVENLIDAAYAAAEAQHAGNLAEAERIANNTAAYEGQLAALADLEEQLDAMVEKVRDQFPEADVTAEINAAREAIDNARAEADAAFEAVAEAGEYDYHVDAVAIRTLIENIEEAAAKSVVEPGKLPFGMTVTPSTEETLESLSGFTLHCEGLVLSYWVLDGLTLTLPSGDVVELDMNHFEAQIEWGESGDWNDYTFLAQTYELDETYTEKGEYVLNVPAGMFEIEHADWSTTPVPAFTVTWNVDPVVSVGAVLGEDMVNVCTIDGRALIVNGSADQLKTLGAGLYIINGKKVMIKH